MQTLRERVAEAEQVLGDFRRAHASEEDTASTAAAVSLPPLTAADLVGATHDEQIVMIGERLFWLVAAVRSNVLGILYGSTCTTDTQALGEVV